MRKDNKISQIYDFRLRDLNNMKSYLKNRKEPFSTRFNEKERESIAEIIAFISPKETFNASYRNIITVFYELIEIYKIDKINNNYDNTIKYLDGFKNKEKE